MENCNHTSVPNQREHWDRIGETIACDSCGKEFLIRYNKWDDSIYYIAKEVIEEKDPS